MKNKSFTLIELLVVIVIIGILAGVIMISTSSSIDKANVAKSKVFEESVANDLAVNMVSRWKLDEGSLTNASDTWGFSSGTLYNFASPSTSTSGWVSESDCVYGKCLRFDGSDDYIDCGNNPSLSMGTGDQTISLWVKFNNTAAPQHETLVFTGGGTDNPGVPGYWIIRSSGTSKLWGEFSDGTLTRIAVNLSADGALVANTWYNIVVIFDRDDTMYSYINGIKQVGYSGNISAKTQSVSNYTSLKIGVYRVGAGTIYYKIAGGIDDIRIYNAALSFAQIKQNYIAGLDSLLSNGNISKEDYNRRINELAYEQ